MSEGHAARCASIEPPKTPSTHFLSQPSFSLQAVIAQRNPAKAFTISAKGPGWTATHDTASKNWLFSASRAVAGGVVDVVQSVPGARWFLVPTPLLRYTKSFDRGDVLSAEFCNQTRRSELVCEKREERWGVWPRPPRSVFLSSLNPPLFSLHSPGAISHTFVANDGLKAGIAVDSAAGLTLRAAQSLKSTGSLTSVEGVYNAQAGPALTVKAKPSPWASAAATLLPRARTAVATASLSPDWLAAGPGKTATLRLDVSAPYGAPRAAAGGKQGKPKAVAGIKWTF